MDFSEFQSLSLEEEPRQGRAPISNQCLPGTAHPSSTWHGDIRTRSPERGYYETTARARRDLQLLTCLWSTADLSFTRIQPRNGGEVSRSSARFAGPGIASDR